jgi:hypothetical protein
MANAEELRKSATKRFLDTELGHGSDDGWRRWGFFQTIVRTPAFDDLHDEAVRATGEFVERAGWRALGAYFGYFDRPETLSDEDRAVLREVLALPQIERWPRWFRRYATILLEMGMPDDLPWANIQTPDPEAIAVFQSAVVLAEELRDPLVVALQWSIQSANSVLDGGLATPDAQTLMAQFERYENENVRHSLPQSIAGFFKFIEVAMAFDNLFVADREGLLAEEDLSPLSAASAIYAESARLSIGRATANLMSWQLNLLDELTVRRLSVVVNAFWKICETHLRHHMTPDESWAASDSRDYLVAMLERWRDRADPGARNRGISLSVLKGTEQEARGESTGRKIDL